MSRPNPDVQQTGFAQEFGRFEVRAKLAKGPGSWNAHWLLPVESSVQDGQGNRCGWPFDSEIDMMEQWAKDENYKSYKASIHTGDCARSIYSNEGKYHPAKRDLTETFNTYGVEWNKDTIRFTFNDEEVAFFPNGSQIRSQFFQQDGKTNFTEEDLKKRFNHRLQFPTGPFYFLLTTSVEGVTKAAPDFSKEFIRQVQAIDFVRAYRRCTAVDPKNECRDIRIKSKVDGYNRSDGETAFAELNVFPNPVVKSSGSQEATIRLTLQQDCQDVNIDLINIMGQRVRPMTNKGGNLIAEDESLQAEEDHHYQLYTHNLQAGLYFVRAAYEQCGPDRSGRGTQVFKFLVQ